MNLLTNISKRFERQETATRHCLVCGDGITQPIGTTEERSVDTRDSPLAGMAPRESPRQVALSLPDSPRAKAVVSVITVNFNGGALLCETVRRVLASTVPLEMIVIDNASADRSLIRLREEVSDPRLRILENARNLGFARANNQAIGSSSGEWILFLNPDCLVQPETVAQMKTALENYPSAGMAGCLIHNPDGTEQAGCRRSSPTLRSAFGRAFRTSRWLSKDTGGDFVLSATPLPSGPVPVDAISGAFMFVRRSALEQVGLLDEGYFLHCEDLDWCHRFRQANHEILFVPHVAVVHYQGHCSRQRPLQVLWHMHRGMARYYQKFLRDRCSRPLRWLVIAGIALRFLILAPGALLRLLAGPRFGQPGSENVTR